jgi:hypothetical protein
MWHFRSKYLILGGLFRFGFDGGVFWLFGGHEKAGKKYPIFEFVRVATVSFLFTPETCGSICGKK